MPRVQGYGGQQHKLHTPDCCTPAFFPTSFVVNAPPVVFPTPGALFVELPINDPGIDFQVSACNLDLNAVVTLIAEPTQVPVGSGPVFPPPTIVSAGPNAQVVTFALDSTTNPSAGDLFVIQATNVCGCCGAFGIRMV